MSNSFDGLMRVTLRGGLPITLFLLGMVAGVMALWLTPREEEPQIVVPMVDVMVQAPGLSAKQVERQVTIPLEKLLAQIPGVEHVYSMTDSGRAAVTLRFYVGEDREDSILNTYNKLYSNQDRLPPVVSDWLLKPIEVDDVPIIMLGLWSEDASRYSDYELRRIADEVSTVLQGIPQTSEVKVVGGRSRTISIQIDPESMSAHQTTAGDIVTALRVSNILTNAGNWTFGNRSVQLEAGDFLRDVSELQNFVVNVIDGVPVYLRDVAHIEDGPAEADFYSWIDFTTTYPAAGQPATGNPLVAISVAKQRGSNAVAVAQDVHQVIAELQRDLLPPEVHVQVLRDYGQTADEKVNSLSASLGFAIVTVVVFIGVFLGWRQAIVVGLAVPICYGVTLALDMAFGYTINRVTLFALILSLGLLVDDPITGVDNISRFMSHHKRSLNDRVSAAMAEIKVPLVMSTLTIILAFLPLAFITGMMGPYMAPMAFNVPVSVISSTLVAFLVTPWLARHLLKEPAAENTAELVSMSGFYPRFMAPLLDNRGRAKVVLWGVLLLFLAAALLPVLRAVPLKLLPFDNKNEIQILIDMPQSASLEGTASLAREVSTAVARVPEVQVIATFVGIPSPEDFNGLVRRYYQRHGPHLADLRLILADKTQRKHQSHAVVLRLRQLLAPLGQDGVTIKVVEVPPGPPVLSTLVAEVYGETVIPYEVQKIAARALMARLAREPHVVEIDSTVEDPKPRLRFVTDKQKAALSGISTEDVSQTLSMANRGFVAGYLQLEREARPLPIELRMPAGQRSSENDFLRLKVRGRQGVTKASTPQGLEIAPQPLVPLGELGQFETGEVDQVIYHKDLNPVVYVMAELNGRTPAEVIADVHADLGDTIGEGPSNWQQRTYLNSGSGDGWRIPAGTDVVWTGEGEWLITVDVFRDMGLGYLFALLAIFVVLRMQTSSTPLSLIIMSAIPLTIIGIMPGFWAMNQLGERVIAGAPEPVLFTATAMIGMIALAGIVVRNSLILVEFISQARARGASIRDALLQAGSVRMRPVLLTAGTTMLGNLIITLDPVFNGLALAIIFGIVASTLFSLIVVPIVYLLVFDKQELPLGSTKS